MHCLSLTNIYRYVRLGPDKPVETTIDDYSGQGNKLEINRDNDDNARPELISLSHHKVIYSRVEISCQSPVTPQQNTMISTYERMSSLMIWYIYICSITELVMYFKYFKFREICN